MAKQPPNAFGKLGLPPGSANSWPDPNANMDQLSYMASSSSTNPFGRGNLPQVDTPWANPTCRELLNRLGTIHPKFHA